MKIPVLTYHHVKPEKDMVSVSPGNFESQLLAIQKAGFSPISISDLLAGKYQKKPILLTFDDGFLDNWLYAFPILKKHGMKATIFITPSRMVESGIRKLPFEIAPHREFARKHEKSEQFCSLEEIKLMQDSGLIEFQSHTLSHLKCDEPTANTAEEIVKSKEIIEKITGKPCLSLAWPYGQYNEKDLEIAVKAGYKAIFTTQNGLLTTGKNMDQRLQRIPRVNVKDRDGDYLVSRLSLYQMPIIGSFYNLIRGIIAIAIMTTLFSSSAKADVLYMKNNTLLFGIVEKDLGEQLLLSISKGDITIPKNRIKRIDYDYKARFNLLEAQDLEGHLALAEFCVKHQLLKEAAEQYTYVTKIPGFPKYVYKNLGDIYYELKDYNNAFIAYDTFRKETKSKNPELLTRISEVNKLRGKTATKLKESKPDSNKKDEGLEQHDTWTSEKWANPSAVLSQAIDDNKILRVDFQDGSKDKTAVGYTLNADISDKTTLNYSIFNNGKNPMKIAIAFVTTPGWAWFESKPMTIKPNWNVGLSMDISGNDFKSEQTKWMHTTPIQNKKNVKKVYFLIYNGKQKGTFFIDDIGFK